MSELHVTTRRAGAGIGLIDTVVRKTLEWVFFSVGVVLVAGCIVIVWLRDARSDALLARFEAARSEAAAQTAPAAPAPPRAGDATPGGIAGVARPVASRPRPAGDLTVLPPDQSHWSAYRRKRYQAQALADPVPLAVLRIPAIGLDVPVLAGTDDPQLERGVGWLTRTAPLGAVGNAALAGHRDSFFRKLGEVSVGDVLRVDTLDGVLEYRVTGHRVVDPNDVSVLRAVDDQSTLTLITCYPFRYVGPAPRRYVVHARRAL